MEDIDALLGDISLSTFLQEYWQQKPLLIRNAIANYSCPISADEMAGLACDEDTESRLILERDGDHPWQCHHGPFDESLFAQLPETHWTLLLQSCNILIPEFAQLLERFRFIPNWRVDDIMLSYAPIGGSVGAHTDHYDVFLLQAQGTRRWQISTKEYSAKDFYPDLDLKILQSFEPQQSWDLEPGDMLYLPPGVAHHGVALNDCMTVSIGFRAPNSNQLSAALLDDILASNSTLENESFYQDPQIPLQENPGEITSWSLQRITSMVSKDINARITDGDWFGKYITDAPISTDIPVHKFTPQQCQQFINAGRRLVRNESTKFAFMQSTQGDIHFFCNGTVSYYPMELLELISLVCNHRYPPQHLLISTITDELAESFLCERLNQGHLYFDDEKDLS